ncbi:MAG: acyl-CoA dehydrogenase family protein [Planctomycetota bacterium]|nr:acyl-CoA dehydrogenase family protein [Planctomycetota bacterium]
MSQKTQTVTKEAEEAGEVAVQIDTSKMSEGKRQALEATEAARETTWKHPSFVAELFLGRFRSDLMFPYPLQEAEDAAKGDAFIAEISEVLEEHVDPDEIDKQGEIPDAAVEALAKLGAFGIKIPRSHGGLGMSQTNYSRAMMYVSSHCGNTSALLSAHQSIGLPQPLILFGTEEQKKKYFPRLAAGEISAFALTETGVGSDPARMTTRAEPTDDGEHFILNGEKLWCTNGTRANLLVVMAQTPPKVVRGKERPQITAFIVERDMPGVEVTHRCHFMGLRSLYNAVMRFKDVKVPRENIIGGEGRGLRVALVTLNTGRLTLPAACSGAAKRCVRIVREFSRDRVQWGAPIGKHEAIAQKLAFITSTTFAMEAMSFYSTMLVDRGGADIRLEAAMCKMYCSERFWDIANETLQIRSGRGYETAESLRARGEPGVPVERFVRDSRINMIFEGTSEIMRLFIAREALDPHLRRAGDLLNPRAPLGKKLQAAGRAGLHYLGWYPGLWNPFTGSLHVHRDLAGHLAWVERSSRKLARKLFHAMGIHQARLERKQALLSRFVEIGTELFAASAACARADALHQKDPEAHRGVIELAAEFCRGARRRVAETFRGVSRNSDRQTYRFAQKVLEGDYEWLEKGAVEFPFH